MNNVVGTALPIGITVIYLIIVLIAFFINSKKDYEDELTKNKSLFNKILISQIIGAVLAELFAISVNGPANHYSMILGIPFMIIEKIICVILAKDTDSKENSEDVKTRKAKLIKYLALIGFIVMGLIIFSTGRMPKNGGNIPNV